MVRCLAGKRGRRALLPGVVPKVCASAETCLQLAHRVSWHGAGTCPYRGVDRKSPDQVQTGAIDPYRKTRALFWPHRLAATAAQCADFRMRLKSHSLFKAALRDGTCRRLPSSERTAGSFAPVSHRAYAVRSGCLLRAQRGHAMKPKMGTSVAALFRATIFIALAWATNYSIRANERLVRIVVLGDFLTAGQSVPAGHAFRTNLNLH